MFWPHRGILHVWRRHRKRERIELEDAVKHLYELGAAKNPGSIDDITNALQISLCEAEVLAHKLLHRHWVSGRIEDGLQLTGAGEQRALHVVRAHRVWESYLARQGKAIEDIHEEADRHEHSTSPKIVDEMERALGRLSYI